MPLHAPPIGAPCWFELSSTDVPRSLAFLKAVFGWTDTASDMGDDGTYHFLQNATGTVGGLGEMPPAARGAPSYWSAYFATNDLDGAVGKALSLGGNVLADPFEVPGMGRGAVLADAGGAMFCLWQSKSPDAGAFTLFEDHSVGWVELATRNVEAAKAFYGGLLGWHFKPSANAPGDTRYEEYGVGETYYGGLLQMTKDWGDLPEHWSIYVMVPELGTTLARVEEAGGGITVPAFDAPGVGRIARIEDPTGAGCYLIQMAG